MTSDVKLLPLPETLLRSGFKSSIEVFARACIEADRKARADDVARLVEAVTIVNALSIQSEAHVRLRIALRQFTATQQEVQT